MLNDPSAYIQIGQDSIPQAVVKNELLGLTFDAIIGVIDAYNNETEHGAIYDLSAGFEMLYIKAASHTF